MSKCIFCNKDLVEFDNDVLKDLGEKLSTNYNNELICYIPHVSKYCPYCGTPEILEDQKQKVLEKKQDFFDIINQEIDAVDAHAMAKQAECRGYACELNDDIAGATINYKACLDIMEMRLKYFEEKNIKQLQDSQDQVLLDQDLQEYADAKVYCDTMRELVVNTSSKSFEKLGYLGILIYLDTITTTKNFVVADKMFALLNDSTTKIPEVLLKAKNQIEDRYIKVRKQNLKK